MPAAKRFRIAFSFAGEMRDFVEKTAAILARKFGQDVILYDKYHEAEFAVYNLGIKLPKLYREECDLVVAVFSRDYDQKRWTGWEWMAIHAQLTKQDSTRIMLTRFHRVNPEGLFENAGFVELDRKSPEETADLILERLALNEGLPRRYYVGFFQAPALRGNILNNLPRLQPFFGREKELAVIREALDPDNRTWGVLINGPGGMGKTSLAVRAAYDSPPGQFKRIVFVSAKDREMDDDGANKLDNFHIPGLQEMFNELARQLGCLEFQRAREAERIPLLQKALGETNSLLVLDNLESLGNNDCSQIFTFLRRLPSGCKAILTSRRRMGSHADRLSLGKFSKAAALETLANLAKREPLLAATSKKARVDLYKKTGTPLLLRWTAGQLGRGSCRTLDCALKFLQSCPRENDPLEFVFGDLARELTENETEILAALTYFTLPANVKHLAAAAGIEELPAESALRSLANRALVTPDQKEQEYTLFPLVAEFLRSHRTEAVAAAGRRLEERARDLITKYGGDNHANFRLLNAAWPSVAPAIELFLAGGNAELQKVCDALWRFLDFTGRWDERLSLSLKAAEVAIKAGDHPSAGWRTYEAGYVYRLRHEAERVLEYAEKAARHWNTARGGDKEMAAAEKLRALGFQLSGNYRNAIVSFEEALRLRQRICGGEEGVSTALNDLAIVHRLAGEFPVSDQYFVRALKLAREIGYQPGIASFTGHYAELALDRGDWRRAEELAREALSLSQNVGRDQSIGMDCRRLALALVRQGKANAADALVHASRAVELFTRLGSPDVIEAQETLKECEAALREVGGGDVQPPK
jgi:tetratricopeptide (TPR) repeat protein